MRHKKIIQEILGKELEKEGFTYVPGESLAWSYERLKDEVWQVISIVRERYCKGYIKIIFNTNAYGQKARELDDFVPENCRNIGIMRRKKNCVKSLHSSKNGFLNMA